MGTAILAFLKSLSDTASSLLGFSKQRDAEKNTAPIQANAAAKTDQQIVDTVTQNVNKADIDSVRKDDAA